MQIDYIIHGALPVPDGTHAIEGVANQFRLPSGEVISVHPVIEMASSLDADDHRDLTYAEASDYGIALEFYDRDCTLVPDD